MLERKREDRWVTWGILIEGKLVYSSGCWYVKPEHVYVK